MTSPAFHWAETALATWTTIALRMPVLMASAGTQTESDKRETERMVTEKITSLQHGMADAGLAWIQLATAAATGEIRTVNGAVRAWSDVMHAFTDHGSKTVRANAKRLSAPHRGGKKR